VLFLCVFVCVLGCVVFCLCVVCVGVVCGGDSGKFLASGVLASGGFWTGGFRDFQTVGGFLRVQALFQLQRSSVQKSPIDCYPFKCSISSYTPFLQGSWQTQQLHPHLHQQSKQFNKLCQQVQLSRSQI